MADNMMTSQLVDADNRPITLGECWKEIDLQRELIGEQRNLIRAYQRQIELLDQKIALLEREVSRG